MRLKIPHKYAESATFDKDQFFKDVDRHLLQLGDYKTFEEEYFGMPIGHDNNACQALKEYENTADKLLRPYRLMSRIAKSYNTTIEEMKKHWKCIDKR